jgi:tetratricopeptide (TPR) repeat protein
MTLPTAQAQETLILPASTSPQTIQSFNEGAKLLMSNQSAKAAEKFATIMSALSGVAEAHSMYGTALLKSGKVDQGLEELEKAARIKPNLPMVLMNLGVAYQTAGRSPEALKQFQKYLQLYPTGTYAKQISAMVNMMKTESSRTEGVESSKGKDHYLPEAIAIGASRWDTATMPVLIYVADGKGVKGYREEFGSILNQAFEEWVAASDGKLTIKYTTDPEAAVIDCRWTDTTKDLINPAEGGQALVFPNVKGHIKQVKIKLLTVIPNSPAALPATTLKHMCLHEIGHSFGLLGHSSQPEDIMFSSVNFEAPHGALSERDKKTLVELYSAPESLLAEKQVNLKKVAFTGDGGPVNESLKLIATGVEQMNAKKYLSAITTFEKARALVPDMDVVLNNLAAAYAAQGNEEATNKDFVHSQQHFQQAADMFKKLHMKSFEKKAYEALASIARIRGNQADVTKFENAAKALGGAP